MKFGKISIISGIERTNSLIQKKHTYLGFENRIKNSYRDDTFMNQSEILVSLLLEIAKYLSRT